MPLDVASFSDTPIEWRSPWSPQSVRRYRPDPVEAESPNAERIADLYWFVSFWAALVLLAVAVRWRSSSSATGAGAGPHGRGPQIHGSTKLEIAWTLVPVVILLFVVAFTFYKLPGITLEDEAQAGDLRIRVEGRQFYWQYRYPNGVIAIDGSSRPGPARPPRDHGARERRHPQLLGARDRRQVRRHSRHDDADRVPGGRGRALRRPVRRVLRHPARRDAGGDRGQAAEEFDSWLEEQAQAQRAGSSDLGEQTFAGACAKCHGPEGQGLIGPEFTSANTADAEAVARVVRNGRGRMPPIGEEWRTSTWRPSPTT